MNISELPPELQELAHKRQIEQGNDGTFDGSLLKEACNSNFTWDQTFEGQNFWQEIYNGSIELAKIKFPHLYPNQTYDIY